MQLVALSNAIKMNHTLTKLSLERSRIYIDKGCIKLSEGLNNTLQRLYINDFENEGLLALAEAIKVNTALVHIKNKH